MKIVMHQPQYEELNDLVDIFEGCFFDGEAVQCFDFIKELVDKGHDTEDIPEEVREKMRVQMTEAFEWIEGLIKGASVKIEYKEKFLSCLCTGHESKL